MLSKSIQNLSDPKVLNCSVYTTCVMGKTSEIKALPHFLLSPSSAKADKKAAQAKIQQQENKRQVKAWVYVGMCGWGVPGSSEL